jgi:hypothetical protein
MPEPEPFFEGVSDTSRAPILKLGDIQPDLWLSCQVAYQIWADLRNGISLASDRERKLYDALTQRFTLAASLLGAVKTETPEIGSDHDL